MNGVVAIVQARMGSTRFPGKVLETLGYRKLLDEVIARGVSVSGIDRVVVATSLRPEDDMIARHCASNGTFFYRGSESDVLDRIFQAAAIYEARHVVRLTADNPLFDPASMSALVLAHLRNQNDYTHAITTWGCLLPCGTGAEIFSMATLEASWREGREPRHREHVDEFAYENPERFQIGLVQPASILRRPELKFTVDLPADLEMMRRIFTRLEQPDHLLELSDVIAFLDKNPELRSYFL